MLVWIEGKILSGVDCFEEVIRKMVLEGCSWGSISYVEKRRVPKGWCIMAERIGHIFVWFVKFMVESVDLDELKVWFALLW